MKEIAQCVYRPLQCTGCPTQRHQHQVRLPEHCFSYRLCRGFWRQAAKYSVNRGSLPPRTPPAPRLPETLMTTIRQRFRRTPLIGLFACRYVDNNQLSIKSGVCRHAPSSQTLSQLCDKQYDSNTYRRHSTTLIKYH